ncbi:MAG: molecular chaperone DnaJ [Reyranella sp.]|uniref:molecular chaperone DnaJ n=1 Tax=Reyranella sp. TaxID=1929291 RepID=UPI0027303F58|nr:molecular chaperone DnaJ [Reyranella sp.]MDP1961535.1 molecular chaperone DnaJ [Reyranella sp.]MDP2378023.1 molecular chaperone DnaJ [Reyranella sp.]
MPAIFFLGVIVLAAVALGIAWFLRANPSSIARLLRPILVVLGAIGVGGFLIFGIRFLPSMLPELMGMAGVVIAALIARAARRRPSGGFSSPGAGAGQRTEVRTAFLQAWIDHATGDVGGAVLSGRFVSRTLDSLADTELLDLHAECASDSDSLKVLEAYLDRRLGGDWRNVRRPPPAGSRTDMSRNEALAVLGLAEGATADEIRAAHRRLIQRMHPDVGGSADLAARINRAKDILLGG